MSVAGHTINYQAVARTILVAATNDADAALGTTAQPPKETPDAPPTARIFYVAYFKERRSRRFTSGDFYLQRWPRQLHHLVRTWAHSVPGASSRLTTSTPAPRLTSWSTTPTACSTRATWFSLTHPEQASAVSTVKIRKRHSGSSIRMLTPLPVSSPAFSPNYQRWNSPKYLFGESYGTTRSAVVAGILETESHIDLNGVILLSQILNFDDSADEPQWNPGIDVPYILALPTFAATAYYHKRLPAQPAALEPFLAEVEQFAMSDYASALAQGSQLPEATRQAIAEKLHQYTGLPVAYVLKADLRVNVGQFNHNLQGSEDLTTGRLDSRFSGTDHRPAR